MRANTGHALLVLSIALLCAPMTFAEEAAAQEVAAIDSASDSDPTAAAAAKTGDAPEPTIEHFHEGLLEIMKQAQTLGFEGRVDRLNPLMASTFDLDFMASKTVGRHWRKLSDADKARWTEAFTRLTMASYAGRFTGFTGEVFEITGVEDAARGTKVVLSTIVVPDEDDVQLNYRLVEKDGRWRVIDVYLNGTVSELALRRSEYSSALKREGFEQLIAAVETKIADLKAKGQTEG